MNARLGLLLTIALLTGCSGGSSAAAAPATSSGTPSSTSTASPTDLTSLPIDDYKYASSPAIESIYSCVTNFGAGGGANTGPWFNAAAGTFNLASKTTVSGSVSWSPAFSATILGAVRRLTTNDLPSHTTGTFPIAASDAAYQYDRNPNSIQAQSIQYNVPATPTVASTPSCVGLGPIGVLLTGAVLYNGLDGGGRDGMAHEVLDVCWGHPDLSGTYHYHALTPCQSDPGSGHSNLLGYARDGFGIYGVRDVDGSLLIDAKLDVCHGHTHAITWDGVAQTMYHYHLTYEYPYSLGCYRGTPV